MKTKKQNHDDELNYLEFELREQYMMFGKKILDYVNNEQIQIDKTLNRIIEEKKCKILEEAYIQCHKCMTLNTNDSNYCKWCGTPLDKQEETENELKENESQSTK